MITPIEVKQQTFKKGFQGYNKDEVQAFLNTLSVEWERVLDELKRTKQDLEKTSTQLDGLRQVESALHKTLLQAEETSRHTIESAKQESETKIREANDNAKEIVQKAMNERERIETQIKDLVVRRDEILKQLKGYLVAQTDRLKTFEDKEQLEAPDFAKLKAKKKEVPAKKEETPSNDGKKPEGKPDTKAEAPAKGASAEAKEPVAKVKESAPAAKEAVAPAETKEEAKAETTEASGKPSIKVEVKTDAKAAVATEAVAEGKDAATSVVAEGKKSTINIVAKDKKPGEESAKEGEGSAGSKTENPKDSADNSGIKVKLTTKEPAQPAKEEKSGSFFDQSIASGDDGGYIDDIVDEL